MSSKTSFINKGIFINDLKRFSWIGVVYTIALFFSVPLQIIMYYNNQEYLTSTGYNPITQLFLFTHFQKMLILVIPVLTAVFLFRYLQAKESVDMFHSLPVSRQTMFNTHVLSGIVILTVPVIFTAILTGVLNFGMDLSQYYSAADVFAWLGVTLLMSTVLFLFGALIAMISGISAVQGVLTYIILFLPVGLTMLVFSNLEKLVYGFDWDYYFNANIELFSPLTRITVLGNGVSNGEPLMTFLEVSAYVLIAAAVCLAAVYLYKKRKMEAASQAITFDKLQPIFKYGVTFCSMLVGGLYFWEVQRSLPWAIFGYVVGSIIGYTVAEIIIKKTWRVFRGAWKGFLVYAVVAVILFMAVNYDITGYENRLPNKKSIESVYMGHSLYPYLHKDAPGTESLAFYYDQDNVENILSLHNAVIRDKDKNFNIRRSMPSRNIVFLYRLEKGDEMARSYTIKQEDYNKYFKPIYESQEFKEINYDILSVTPEEIDKITITSRGSVSKRAAVTEPQEIREAVEILQEEVKAETYEEMTDALEPWANVKLLLTDGKSISVSWDKTYIEFEDWLNENGYLDNARVMPEDIAYAAVSKKHPKEAAAVHPRETGEVKNVPEDALTITDKEKIETCLRKYTGKWDENTEYFVGFYAEDSSMIIDGGFSEDNIPGFVLQHDW